MTIPNGKFPLTKFNSGNAYEGERLHGKKHGHGVYTCAHGAR